MKEIKSNFTTRISAGSNPAKSYDELPEKVRNLMENLEVARLESINHITAISKREGVPVSVVVSMIALAVLVSQFKDASNLASRDMKLDSATKEEFELEIINSLPFPVFISQFVSSYVESQGISMNVFKQAIDLMNEVYETGVDTSEIQEAGPRTFELQRRNKDGQDA